MSLIVQSFGLYFRTIKHLTFKQFAYRVLYGVKRKMVGLGIFFFQKEIKETFCNANIKKVLLKPNKIEHYKANCENLLKNEFTFLNKTHNFSKRVDWHAAFLNKGTRLWKLNLNYHEYLIDIAFLYSKTKISKYIHFIENHIKEWLNQNPLGTPEYYKDNWSSYAISLRLISWIKIYSLIGSDFSEDFKNKLIISIQTQVSYLKQNIEFDIRANHLLENFFCLLFCSFFLADFKLFKKTYKCLKLELDEQILFDGGHFELSPMYHQIILYRLLDCINLLKYNHRFADQEDLLISMLEKAQKMLNWLNVITFKNGKIPLFNDAASGIAPTTKQLNEYALTLSIKPDIRESILFDSGYRRFDVANYECIIDVGQISPSYQPGHSHADTLSFVLNYNNKPVFVDNGCSTYDAGETRLKERGTSAHNTVTVKEKNSSEVWSSFRVGRRANVQILNENNKTVVAQHNGYRAMGVIHRRKWCFLDKQIQIIDTLIGKINNGKAHLWLAPNLKPIQTGQTVKVENMIILFKNASSIMIIPTKTPNGYNRFLNNYKIEIVFINYLKTIINFSQ